MDYALLYADFVDKDVQRLRVSSCTQLGGCWSGGCADSAGLVVVQTLLVWLLVVVVHILLVWLLTVVVQTLLVWLLCRPC